MLAMQIDPDTVQFYLNNPYFSPALQTIMVEALESMQEVANRALLLKVSLQANGPEMARTITEITTMTAGYNKNIEPLKKLSPVGRIVYATARDGNVVVLFPADHVLWTEKVADITTWLVETEKEQNKKSAGFQLWILGDFSQMAQAGLEKAGWKFHPAAQKKLFPAQKKILR